MHISQLSQHLRDCAGLVPLQHRNALFAPKYGNQADFTGQYGNHVKKSLRTETEDLRPMTLAFVLGLRGGIAGQQVPELLGAGGENPPVYNGHNVGIQPAIMPGMAGTERFQQLCSLEYLHAYYDNVLSGKVVELDNPMTNPTDLAKLVKGLQGSEAADAAEVYQGIFARDLGPFLKGKGGKTALVNCTHKNLPQQVGRDGNGRNITVQPFAVSRNLGDDVAFERLEATMAAQGLTDWRPDGIVLSKGVNDPSDKMSDEYLEARDGQLYNLRVQGPAVGITWTGERSMETLPLDKVFIVLIADVWFNKKIYEMKSKAAVDQYRKDRADALAATGGERFDASVYEGLQVDAFKGDLAETTTLCNFRVEASTSSEMINYSQFKPKQKAPPGAKKRRLEGRSRMGLDLCQEFGEFIVGAWQIGNVMDTSASRAAMPQGSNIGVRTAPNTSALNINVNIGWWSADRLARAFNNADGAITPRYVKTRIPALDKAVNAQLTKDDFEPRSKIDAENARAAGRARLQERANLSNEGLREFVTAARPGGSGDVSGAPARS